MEVYEYLVKLMKRVKGPCNDLVFNKEVKFQKTDENTVCLSMASFYTESIIPINSIKGIEGGFVVNGNITVNLKEIYLEFRMRDLSPEMFELIIQDAKDSIEFLIPYRGGIKVTFGNNKIKFGPIEIDLTGQEIKLIPATEEYFELVVGNSKIQIPKRSAVLFEIRKIDRAPMEY